MPVPRRPGPPSAKAAPALLPLLLLARACAMDAPGEEVRRALLAGEPVLKPPGRRLGGGEIQATFAGRRLEGAFWPLLGTGVTLSTV
jgi:hypothetical protein